MLIVSGNDDAQELFFQCVFALLALTDDLAAANHSAKQVRC